MSEKMTTAEMIGEGLRELGILVFMFIPLDYFFSDFALAVGWVWLLTVVLGGGLFLMGVVIERRRE